MKESDIQNEIMEVLIKHPLVAWAYVTTTGTFQTKRHGGTSWMKIGIKGMPDILGQLIDGRILGIEVKKPGEKPKPEQYDFLRLIALNDGLAFWADSADYVKMILDKSVL